LANEGPQKAHNENCCCETSLLSEERAESLILLSALQHYLYCPRQCALIHLDQAWEENLFTAEGRVLHTKADSGQRESRGSLRTETGVLLRSDALLLTGKADVVEFHRKEDQWVPFPVEYKRGSSKTNDADRVQLCAQALCLEEMTGSAVPEGALFYGKTRRREQVFFDHALREKTRETIDAVRDLLAQSALPAPDAGKKCEQCSLNDVCAPKICSRNVAAYLEGMYEP
jgi:CRISPR-associated exonuclease Cas4